MIHLFAEESERMSTLLARAADGKLTGEERAECRGYSQTLSRRRRTELEAIKRPI